MLGIRSKRLLVLLLSFLFVSPSFFNPLYAKPHAKSMPNKASYQGLEEDKFMTRWRVLEPIPVFSPEQNQRDSEAQKKAFNADDHSFKKVLKSVRKGVYTLASKQYHWRHVNTSSHTVDLVGMFGEQDFHYAYASADIHAPKAKQVLFSMGSDDGVKVWLNGKLIHENWVARGVNHDDDIFAATLKKGKNRLLIKVQNMQGGWGFSNRILSQEQKAKHFVYAGCYGDLETMELLLTNGVNVNTITPQGITAWHCASIRKQKEATQWLVEHGGDTTITLPAKSDIVDMLFSRSIKPNTPGAAIAVIQDGAIIYKNGYGAANLEYDIPITPKTVFHVASVSKQFTAFALAMLADQGKLSLDDDIRQHLLYVPDFGHKITIRHLIHHTSGLRDQWELLAIAGWRLDDVITKEHVLKLVRHQKALNFKPGDEELYSNTGYTLMADIVEKVSKMSFREFTHTYMFEPLAMQHTHFHDDHEMIVKNRAYSYVPGNGSAFQKSVLSYANVGATSLFTTAEDLAKWQHNLTTGSIGGKAVIEQMHQTGVLNNGTPQRYAFGLVLNEYKGLKTVAHSGGDAGFRSFAVRFPEHNFSVVLLSNLGSLNPFQSAMDVADIYLADKFAPLEKEAPVQETPKGEPDTSDQKVVKVDPQTYNAYVGQYELFPGFILTISKEGKRLITQATGQDEIEVFPESPTKFFAKVMDAQISFQNVENGEASQLTLHQSGRDTVAKRVKVLPFDVTQMDTFTGEYYSEELGTSYTLALQEGQLVAQHRRHNDIALTPTIKDALSGNSWWFRQVHFVRDNQQKVTGFKLSGWRVRDLMFIRK